MTQIDIKDHTKSMDKLANNMLEQSKGKLYEYKTILDSSGICIIKNITYDKLFKEFIYHIEDIASKCQIIGCICSIYLYEIYNKEED